jgi:Lrp/AsnC family transcriptional regulator
MIDVWKKRGMIIRGVYRLAGRHDFLRRVVVSDTASFGRFHEDLTAAVRMRGVNSVLALEAVRADTPRPSHAPPAA